jgi:hypothetical protein
MDSKKHIGMDVHKERISLAGRNGAGKIVMECVIATKASMSRCAADETRGERDSESWKRSAAAGRFDDNAWRYDAAGAALYLATVSCCLCRWRTAGRKTRRIRRAWAWQNQRRRVTEFGLESINPFGQVSGTRDASKTQSGLISYSTACANSRAIEL